MKEKTTHLTSSANGAPHTSLGQRPRKTVPHSNRALKGRPRRSACDARGIVKSGGWIAPSGLRSFFDPIPRALPYGPRALPWAILGRAFGAQIFRPKGANHASPGQRPGITTTHPTQALKGRPNA